MSLYSLIGAIELGLVYGLVAIGVYLSFRVLNFPDMTVDGSFPLGAAVASTLIVYGANAEFATLMAPVAGAIAGLVTATLNVRFKIMNLLAGILTMTALFSINLRIMGRPNIALLSEDTIITDVGSLLEAGSLVPIFTAGGLLLVVAVGFIAYLNSHAGVAMRTTGMNPKMARANAVNTDFQIYLGLALSNAVTALAGALFSQMNGFADITMGVGTILIGLAAVVIGESIVGSRTIMLAILGCVVGSVIYRLALAMALEGGHLGLRPSDLNLITSVIVAFALIIPLAQSRRRQRVKANSVVDALLRTEAKR